jgi:hypothetical protein
LLSFQSRFLRGGDDSAMMGTPPPSSCTDNEKVPVTLMTQVSEGYVKCSAGLRTRSNHDVEFTSNQR